MANPLPNLGARVEDQRRGDVPLPGPLSVDDVEARSELARHVAPARFPATGSRLVAAAQETGAPTHILERLRDVDPNQMFDNVEQLWERLGGAGEAR